MKAVMVQVEFSSLGRTREEVIQLLDQAGMAFLTQFGGAPWVAHDDDTFKVFEPKLILADELGYLYRGKRTYRFGGPHFAHDGMTQHEGNCVQLQVAE